MITFALEAQHSVRSGMNTAVDHASEVHSEKRKFRIRHRIDKIAHQMPAFRSSARSIRPGRARCEPRVSFRRVWRRDHCADRHN